MSFGMLISTTENHLFPSDRDEEWLLWSSKAGIRVGGSGVSFGPDNYHDTHTNIILGQGHGRVHGLRLELCIWLRL